MLSGVLDKLSSLFSKSMMISSYLPLLVCAIINAGLLFVTNERFHDFVLERWPADTLSGVIQSGAVLFAIAVVAFVLGSLTTFQRELFEGKHWKTLFRVLFLPIESARGRRLQQRIVRLRADRRTLRERSAEWRQQLETAALLGATKPNRYDRGTTRDLLEDLQDGRDAGRILSADDLQPLFVQLLIVLAGNNINATNDAAADLDEDMGLLLDLAAYAEKRYDAEYIALYNEQQISFGSARVAPTAAGNYAEAVSSYSLRRYGMNIDVFWPRLQKVLQGEKYFEVLQDTKTQLDATIAFFWLMSLTTAVWAVWLACTSPVLPLFLSVALAGPVICWSIYKVAVTNYAAFSDLLRTVVDLFRFHLLQDLHVPLPIGTTSEKALWDVLNRWTGYGETPVIKYEHKA